MALHALDAIDDALTATRRFRPRGLFEWVWVTVVAALVATPGISIPTGGTGGGGVTPEQRSALEEALPATLPEWVPLVVAALGVVWLGFVVLGALLEFPFLRWLRDGKRTTIEEIAAHWKQALGLAAFRVALSLVGFAALGALVATATGPTPTPTDYLFALSEYGIVLALVGIPTSIVAAFTTAFVVPTMVLTERGVLGGWRRFWSTLTAAPKQFLAYAVGVALLATVGGILVSIAAVVGFLAAAIVGGLVGLAVAATAVGVSGVVVALAVGILGAILVGAVVYAILQVFLRYYALFVLGAVDADLDFLSDRRSTLDGADAEEIAAPSE
jgi:hypothetical protein